MDQDAAYIITDEERKAFNQLQTDEERDQFIEQFWFRRDPTPRTAGNELKDEHYRRMAYAFQHFTASGPGWKTDRGRAYILCGPPDQIESHGLLEHWRYRSVDGLGKDVVFEFDDPNQSGEYRASPDTDGMLKKLGGVPQATLERERARAAELAKRTELERFEHRSPSRPPVIRFKDLEAQASTKPTTNILPLRVQVDYAPLTEATTLAGIMVQFENQDLRFQPKDGVQRAVVNIYGRITTPARRVVQIFEDSKEASSPPAMLPEFVKRRSLYRKIMPLTPGTYRMNIVAKDVAGGNMNNYEIQLEVPRLDTTKLAQSSLILADLIELVSESNQVLAGDWKVRPRLDRTFSRDEKMGIYLQIYNFVQDPKTRRPNGEIAYEVIRNDTGAKVIDFAEDVAGITGNSTHLTIGKLLPLKNLLPGQYTIRLQITGRIRNETLKPSAQFTII